MMDAQDAIKFTIADRKDFNEAVDTADQICELLGSEGSESWEVPQFFYGPVWGKIEPKELVEWTLEDKLDWRLNIQTHNMIWDRTQRGI